MNQNEGPSIVPKGYERITEGLWKENDLYWHHPSMSWKKINSHPGDFEGWPISSTKAHCIRPIESPKPEEWAS